MIQDLNVGALHHNRCVCSLVPEHFADYKNLNAPGAHYGTMCITDYTVALFFYVPLYLNFSPSMSMYGTLWKWE